MWPQDTQLAKWRWTNIEIMFYFILKQCWNEVVFWSWNNQGFQSKTTLFFGWNVVVSMFNNVGFWLKWGCFNIETMLFFGWNEVVSTFKNNLISTSKPGWNPGVVSTLFHCWNHDFFSAIDCKVEIWLKTLCCFNVETINVKIATLKFGWNPDGVAILK